MFFLQKVSVMYMILSNYDLNSSVDGHSGIFPQVEPQLMKI